MTASFISSDEEDSSVSSRHSGEDSPQEAREPRSNADVSTHTQHRDYLHVVASDVKQEIHCPKGKRRGPRGGVVVPFPVKLYSMLKGVEQEGLEHIVSWQPHGRCFMVHQPKEFVEDIMPRYFRQTKLTSFQRQLNLYGFLRLTSPRDRGGYYHELFLRGRDDLAKIMLRTRVKGNGIKGGAAPSVEPDFYKMQFCNEHDSDSSPDMSSEQEITTEDSMQVLSMDEDIVENVTEEDLSILIPEKTCSESDEIPEIRPVVSYANFEGYFGVVAESCTRMPASVSSASISLLNQHHKPLACPPALLPVFLKAPSIGLELSDSNDDVDTGFFEGQRFRFMDEQSLHAFEMALIRSPSV